MLPQVGKDVAASLLGYVVEDYLDHVFPEGSFRLLARLQRAATRIRSMKRGPEGTVDIGSFQLTTVPKSLLPVDLDDRRIRVYQRSDGIENGGCDWHDVGTFGEREAMFERC